MPLAAICGGTPLDSNFDDATLDKKSIDRRDAMKAALGGAAAAAALSAPKVSGFRVLPDYAAAASGLSTITIGSVGDGTCGQGRAYCWGSFTGNPAVCGPATVSNQTFIHSFQVDVTGDPFGGGTATVEMTNYAGSGDCLVTLEEGNCRANGGTWSGSSIGTSDTLNFTGDTVVFNLDCSGTTNCPSNLNPVATVTVYCTD